MTEIVLHHYPTSPFAELARTALGLKGLSWKSVEIPMMLPKPDLIELTGGYARTPVLQIGADIHCDTAAILDALEALRPAPSLYPAPLGAIHRMVAGWAGAAQFAAHVGAAFKNAPADSLPPGFAADRNTRFVGFDFDAMPKFAPHLETQVLASSSWIAAILADGRPFVGGDQAGHGDLALYSNLWFVKLFPFTADFASQALADSRVSAWHERVAAIGHGTPEPASADDAIAIAKAAAPKTISEGEGKAVTVRTEQSGDQPVAGTLVRCDDGGITVSRESERAGTLHVHFPRIGQIVVPA